VKRLALLTGGLAVAAAALWRRLRRRPEGWVEIDQADPRAGELRRRLDESRAVVDDRDEFEGAETTVDAVEDVPADPAERRRAVHAEGRGAAEKMRGGPTSEE
jgi:hypothetical protein